MLKIGFIVIARFDLLMGIQFFDLLYQEPDKIDLVETGKWKKKEFLALNRNMHVKIKWKSKWKNKIDESQKRPNK